MLLRRFYDDNLAQASYLIGCQATGEALVIDPNRDAEQYLAAARADGVRITHVTETHIHADFVSGSRELASRAGAALLLSGEGGRDWQYAFAESDGATLLRDGDRFTIGNVQVDVMHTPGHTPEHLCFMITDTAATLTPMGMLTGDFVFVGDVGRPDLLERAAKMKGTMLDGARILFRSLQRLRALPDHLQLWPGHGAGSACGKALGAVPQTTLGYERRVNWGLATTDEDEFTRMVLDGQPEPPRYFATMKRVNREGPTMLGALPHPVAITGSDALARFTAGALLVDVRRAAEHRESYLPGSLSVPLNKSFPLWAGSLLPYEHEIVIAAPTETIANEAARALALIGIERVVGWVDATALLDASREAGHEPQHARVLRSSELASHLDAQDVTVLDVRRQSEWDAGHLPGAMHIPLAELAERMDELPRDRPVAVHCQGGGRSAIASSYLRAQGLGEVMDASGGYSEWAGQGRPIVREREGVTGGNESSEPEEATR